MSQNASSTTEIVQQLKEILVRDLDIEAAGLADDVSLLEDGLALDSVVIVELITHIEKRFGIQFDDQHLRSENFASLKTLGELIAAEQATTGTAA